MQTFQRRKRSVPKILPFRNRLKLFSLIFALLFSASSFAEWFEVTGESSILESTQEARQRALEDAVFQVLEFSGADLGTLAEIKPYLATEKRNYVFRGNEIRQINIVKSRANEGVFKITARIDVTPAANDCHTTQYKKGLLIGQFQLESPQEAALGAIFEFGQDFTTLLERQIETQAQSFVSLGISPYDLNQSSPTATSIIAEDANAKFILIGTISDISATLKGKQTNRQLSMNIQVLEGTTGETIYNNAYREIALWPFERNSRVDTKSARFWTSAYGALAMRMSRNILVDIENNLSCRASTPEIIALIGNQGQINAGRIHGVKTGDSLSLWHNDSFIDQFGHYRSQLKKSEISLTITRVYDSSAEFSINPIELSQSIQIGDIATKIL